MSSVEQEAFRSALEVVGSVEPRVAHLIGEELTGQRRQGPHG